MIFGICKYGHAEHSFGYTQFEDHRDAFTAAFLPPLLEEDNTFGLACFITLCTSDSALSSRALKRDAEAGWDQNVGDGLPFIGYDFETGTASFILTTRASKYSKIKTRIVPDIPSSDEVWFKAALYA